MKKNILLSIGWIFVGIGLIGAFLPVLPTTPFLLISLACFARSSPQLHKKLLEHPKFGPALKDWEQSRVIRRKAKIMASMAIALSISASLFFANPPRWAFWVMPLIALATITFIITRKSEP